MWKVAGNDLIVCAKKIMCSIILKMLQEAMVSQLREEQAGFRKDQSCCEHMFTLRNIIEQCLEFQRLLYINYIDFKIAFNSVH